jgi:hypothetical protein
MKANNASNEDNGGEQLLILKVDDMDISGTELTLDNIKDSINVDNRIKKTDKEFLTVTFEEAM